jgi:hypothetical protein
MSAYPLLIPLFAMIAGIAVSRPWGIIASPVLQLGLLAGTGALLFFKSRLPFWLAWPVVFSCGATWPWRRLSHRPPWLTPWSGLLVMSGCWWRG